MFSWKRIFRSIRIGQCNRPEAASLANSSGERFWSSIAVEELDGFAQAGVAMLERGKFKEAHAHFCFGLCKKNSDNPNFHSWLQEVTLECMATARERSVARAIRQYRAEINKTKGSLDLKLLVVESLHCTLQEVHRD